MAHVQHIWWYVLNGSMCRAEGEKAFRMKRQAKLFIPFEGPFSGLSILVLRWWMRVTLNDCSLPFFVRSSVCVWVLLAQMYSLTAQWCRKLGHVMISFIVYYGLYICSTSTSMRAAVSFMKIFLRFLRQRLTIKCQLYLPDVTQKHTNTSGHVIVSNNPYFLRCIARSGLKGSHSCVRLWLSHKMEHIITPVYEDWRSCALLRLKSRLKVSIPFCLCSLLFSLPQQGWGDT